MTSKARRIISELYGAFVQEPRLLPPSDQVQLNDTARQARVQARKVADYIAGMTDRYAMREHRRLFVVDEI